MELAGILHSLGSQVHLWCRGPRLLNKFDTSISDSIQDEMIKTGILLQTMCQVKKIQKIQNENSELFKVTLVKHVGTIYI